MKDMIRRNEWSQGVFFCMFLLADACTRGFSANGDTLLTQNISPSTCIVGYVGSAVAQGAESTYIYRGTSHPTRTWQRHHFVAEKSSHFEVYIRRLLLRVPLSIQIFTEMPKHHVAVADLKRQELSRLDKAEAEGMVSLGGCTRVENQC